MCRVGRWMLFEFDGQKRRSAGSLCRSIVDLQANCMS